MSVLLNLLRQLEESGVSNDKIKEFFFYREDLDGSEVTSYFVKRLKKEHVKPDRLITFLKNIGENNIKHLTISAKLNEVIIWLYHKNFNRKYLYFILNNDPRSIRPLRYDLANYLSDLIISDALYYIEDIADNTKYSVPELCRFVFESFGDLTQGQIRSMMFLNELKPAIINDLLVNILLVGSPIYNNVMEKVSNERVYKYIHEHLNDESGLCEAIQHSPLSITFLNYPALRECIFRKHKKIPKTIKYIFDRAVQEDNTFLLVEMGEVFNRKSILKALVSSARMSGNRDLIDKFIIKNKKYEDMKSFAPFM